MPDTLKSLECESCQKRAPAGPHARFSAPCITDRRRRRRKYVPTREIDDIIRETYESLYRKKALRVAAQRILGSCGAVWPTWKIKRRAAEVGMTTLARKEPDWSAEEIAVLEQYSWMGLERIRLHLKRRCGSNRTITAICLKRKRLHLTPRNGDGYTPNRLAGLFGVDSHKVSRWIKNGWLAAHKRGTHRTAQQGGDSGWITHASVYRFALEHPEEYLLRSVNQLWFLDLLTEGRIGCKGK
jgi:hypothetical protein